MLACTWWRRSKNTKKSLQKDSKMAPKSIKNLCWKPSKSMSNYFELFKSFQIDFSMIFINFSSKMDPKMDQKINKKSTPSPPGLLEGPRCCAHMPWKSQCEDIGTHTAIRILGSGHCGGVGAQRIEIYMMWGCRLRAPLPHKGWVAKVRRLQAPSPPYGTWRPISIYIC